MGSGKLRVALYSPGMVGLGHLRRNLLLVRRFAAAYPEAAFLMLTEAREAGSFGFPDAVDCVSLPAIRKDEHGCAPRRLALELSELLRLRAAVLETALDHFAPDVLFVDHLPRGALGELDAALARVRSKGGTRLVLGLRDILEEPAVVRAEWSAAGHEATIESLYDAVWIYGERAVYDPIAEYGFSAALAAKAEFTGYLNPLEARERASLEDADCLATQLLGSERVILCQLGGGQDGVRLAEAFIEAELPADAVGVLVTGPFMPRGVRERLQARCRERPGRRHVLGLIGEPTQLLTVAERVITMGGYNSLTEVVALGKHALVVPRTRPRREQLLRAQRFAALGLVELLHPDRLSAAALAAWIARPLPDPRARGVALDMNGLDRVVGYLDCVVQGRWDRRRAAQPAGAIRAIA